MLGPGFQTKFTCELIGNRIDPDSAILLTSEGEETIM